MRKSGRGEWEEKERGREENEKKRKEEEKRMKRRGIGGEKQR